MFEPRQGPRVFGLAPGVDFPKALLDGLIARLEDQPPEALARVDLIVNTARMERRLRQLFDDGPARLLPRLHLVTRLDQLAPAVALPPAVHPLRRRLDLIALVARLLERAPDLAPRTSLYALADSLAALIEEMEGEGVTGEDIRALDLSEQSEHWHRAQAFIGIAQEYLARTETDPGAETRQRRLVAALAAHWAAHPPRHPVIVAGSTGSRGTTRLLMEAVARLPQGALVLPGFDFDMTADNWADLDDPMRSQDHPQYRFHELARDLGIPPQTVRRWHDTPPPAPERNALISLSLRPAPVTHAWRVEGPRLQGLDRATAGMTLLEAPSPRVEALAIALRLREAVETGQRAAVISPDRMLTRRITAALDQWNILPDDSAGTPLHLSPPGRFLRQVARLFQRRLDAEALLGLLKHPLTHSSGDRGPHALHTQRLEVRIRRNGLPYPNAAGLFERMREAVSAPEERAKAEAWAGWVASVTTDKAEIGTRPLADWVARHLALSEAIASGPTGSNSGELWQKKAGREARAVMDTLAAQAEHGQPMTAGDYVTLVDALLADAEVRDRDAPHPGVMIWGTLEARVQGADLVILAGLNDGTWPEPPAPDPWLNRQLRARCGLLLPDRRIGLSCHDYQQAIAAGEVWITRSIRSDDAETVPSRWLNRLCNLLDGLGSVDGPALLEGMRARGTAWCRRAERFEAVTPAAPAPRPSPCPPAEARPRRLAVTDIKHLIRDPYAIYAKHVLRLRPLGPLLPGPDALARGTVLHAVMEAFVRGSVEAPELLTTDALMDTASEVLARDVPWPTARTLWMARLSRIAPWFVEREAQRRAQATPVAFEEDAKGELVWPDIGFTLKGRADRIDRRTDDGAVLIYDYKTGQPPTAKEQTHFDKQLLIEAAMIEAGAFPRLGPCKVAEAVFIGLGGDGKEVAAPLAEEPPEQILRELRELVLAYLDPGRGFTARRAMREERYAGDYDLLSRFGEWDITQDPLPETLA